MILRCQHIHLVNPLNGARSGNRPATERDIEVWWDSELAMFCVLEQGKALQSTPRENVKQVQWMAAEQVLILAAFQASMAEPWRTKIAGPTTAPNGQPMPHAVRELPPQPPRGFVEALGDEPDLAAEFPPVEGQQASGYKPSAEEAHIARELRQHAQVAAVSAANPGDANAVARAAQAAEADQQANRIAAANLAKATAAVKAIEDENAKMRAELEALRKPKGRPRKVAGPVIDEKV